MEQDIAGHGWPAMCSGSKKRAQPGRRGARPALRSCAGAAAEPAVQLSWRCWPERRAGTAGALAQPEPWKLRRFRNCSPSRMGGMPGPRHAVALGRMTAAPPLPIAEHGLPDIASCDALPGDCVSPGSAARQLAPAPPPCSYAAASLFRCSVGAARRRQGGLLCAARCQ